jgi:hypothetical protein
MSTIRIISDEQKDIFQVQDGDKIIVSPNVRWIDHTCCNCGCKHKWYIKAKKGRTIIIKMYKRE